MPRKNAGGNKKGQTREYQRNNPNKEVCDRLDLSWQHEWCYNFLIHLETIGEEGWDPCHTINHWRDSLYLQKIIKKRSCNSRSKREAAIAESGR